MVNCGKPPHSVAGQPLYDEVSSNFAAWSAVICCVFGIVGNSTTLFVLLKSRTIRRHATTPFLVSLAFSDLIFSSFNLPLLAHRFFHRDWTLSYNACVAFPFFMYSNVSVSSLSMMLISINRFVGIYFSNIMDKIFTPLKSWLSVLGLWAFSFIIMSLPLAEVWGQYGYVKGTFSCTLLEKNGHTPLVFFSILIIGIPCLVILICYSLILYKVRSTGRAMRFLTQSTDAGLDKDFTVGSMTRTRERELTKTFGIICLCYIISFIPVSILSVFDPMPPCWENPGWHVFGYVMFWCSAIINPIVYILANRHYRKYFIYYVQRLFCMNPADPTTTLHSATYKPTPQSSGRVPRKEYPSLPRERKPRHEHQESLEMEPFRNQESVEQVQRFEPSQPIAPPLYENVATRSPKGSLMVTDI